MEEYIKILEEIVEIYRSCSVNEEGFDMMVDIGFTKKECEALQNLIARYKELEHKNKTLETLLQGNLYQMYLYYKELAGRYQANSISKDKVKEKIEELKNGTYDAKIILQQLIENTIENHIPIID